MTRKAITVLTEVLAFGVVLALHQPAAAGMKPTLETATSGGVTWTYTAGGSGQTYRFAPIEGATPLGDSKDPGTPDTVLPVDPPGRTSIPEPGTLALLAFALLCVAASRVLGRA